METSTMFDLSGRVALVTGSSRGIGRALALALARHGASVVVHGSSGGRNLDDAVSEINAAGGKAIGVAADLGSSEAVVKLLAASRGGLGKIDILVLNASVQSYLTVEEFDVEEFQREYAVNLKSSFELVSGVLPEMKSRGWGRVLSIGSVNQWKQSPRLAIYSTTKSAQVNLVMNCAREYAKYGITFNNLAPGIIATDRNAGALADTAVCHKLLGLIPAARFGAGDDCVGPALMLCSNAGGYVTGADIPVTGGMHL